MVSVSSGSGSAECGPQMGQEGERMVQEWDNLMAWQAKLAAMTPVQLAALDRRLDREQAQVDAKEAKRQAKRDATGPRDQ